MAKPKKSKIQLEIEKQCIAIVDRERTNWEEAVTFVTPKVAFRMRELIRILRKNFWGVFDHPYDKNTSREKIWINLAMATVETWTKNIDIDQKDISFVARSPEGDAITDLTRIYVKQYLDKMYFGETLDADERQVLIDGTVVWKTWEDKSSGKPVLKRRTVDLLNVYIDPTEENIQSAYRFTERGIFLPSQIAAMSGWINTDDLPGSQVLNRVDGSRRSNFGTRSTADYRDVWETWGKIPKKLITGDFNAKDADDEVDGHIVVSGLEAPEPTLHLVEYNTNKDSFGNIIKPYEEWRAAKISGRWYGMGPLERILALQEYLNTIVNIRINKHYISQLGLFKIKKGKGITSAMLGRLSANGGIQLTDMEDLQPMEMSPDDGSSYKDEDVIKYWAQNISSAFPISNGDIMPASATATANSIASNSAKSSYSMFIEGTGSFLERWLDRGALPIIAKTLKAGDILRITKEDSRFDQIAENVALNIVAQELENSTVIPSREELLRELVKIHKKLLSQPQLFVNAVQEIIASQVESKVQITNEDLDTQKTIENLMAMLKISPEDAPEIKPMIYDLMGLSMPSNPIAQASQPQQPQQMPGMAQGVPQSTMNNA